MVKSQKVLSQFFPLNFLNRTSNLAISKMVESKKFKPDPTKRSLVKHKTKSGFGLQGRNNDKFKKAFRVGPKNAPDGAYLGKGQL